MRTKDIKMTKLEKITTGIAYALPPLGIATGLIMYYIDNQQLENANYVFVGSMIGGLISASIGAISYKSRFINQELKEERKLLEEKE